MNFFEHQQRARQNTWKLVILFFIAVLIIILLTSGLIGTVLWGTKMWSQQANISPADSLQFSNHFNLALFAKVTAVTICVIALVIYLKFQSLQSGVSAIAEQLGGKRVLPNNANFEEKQLLNVVEEMAIASGMPMPTVYLLPDTSINAFAAGLQQDDAIIGVTKGTIERLNRDQLQGVIAHEFSHLLHGDSRLNVYLLVILAGIVFLSTAGRVVLDSSHRVGLQYTRSKTGLPVLLIGIGLLVLGYIGQFFGNLIKSSVSRQREYLADASAVQYTRNPEGISDALKIIQGSGAGTVLMSAHASDCSHLFFGDAIGTSFFSLFSTHPPVEKRIRRIQPNWDGRYLKGKPITPITKPQIKTRKQFQNQLDNLQNALASTGLLDAAMISVADGLLQSLPAELHQSTQQTGSAIALMYALRLHSNLELQQQQLQAFDDNLSLKNEVVRLHGMIADLDKGYVLPLVELSIPPLKSLSLEQYTLMKKNLARIISIDQVTDYKEWLHYRLLCHYLDSHFQIPRKSYRRSYHAWYQVADAASNILSLMAWFGSSTKDIAEQSFLHASSKLNLPQPEFKERNELTLESINNSLEKLDFLVPLLKEQFLSACAAGIDHDQKVTFMEWDLLRVISACLSCPMPLIQRPKT